MYGTGWLGWSADQTLDTPMPQLFLALKGKIDYVEKTNPFGASEKKEEVPESAEARAKLNAYHLKKAELINKMKAKNG
jgi:hypothetical protein